MGANSNARDVLFLLLLVLQKFLSGYEVLRLVM